MKSAGAALAAHLAQPTTTLAACWKVGRTDGRILGFTDHDRDLAIDLGDGDGTITYAAATGYDRTAIKSTGRLNVDNLEVVGVLDSTAVTVADIRAGRYDFAEVKIFLVNWADPAQGVIKLRRGHIGELTRREERFVAELRGLTQQYSQEVVGLFSPACRADLGDQPGPAPSAHGCKVRLDPPVWQAATAYSVCQARDAAAGSVVKPSAFNDRHFKCVGFGGGSPSGSSGASEPAWNTAIGGQTGDGGIVWEAIQALTIEADVASVAGNREFSLDYAGDAGEALLTRGLCTFLDSGSPSPLNAGLKMEVKQYTVSPPTVTLFLPMPFDVRVGDPVTISAGCAKTIAVCRDTFDNVENFRGEPYVPGNDLLFRTPDAG